MLEDLIRAVGTEQFSRRAFCIFRSELAIRYLTIARYAHHQPLEILAVECDGSGRLFYPAIDHYMRTSSRGDPLRSYYRGSQKSGHLLFSVAPDQVHDAEARQRLYSTVGIAGKLALLIQRSEDVLALNVYRPSDVGCFGARQIELMRSWGPTIAAAVERHVAILQSPSLRGDEELHKLIREIPQGSRLSKQEASVCAQIIAGHSTEGIALNLSVSTNSVATYRRRAYAKLNVSSQNELFLALLGLCTRRHVSAPLVRWQSDAGRCDYTGDADDAAVPVEGNAH